MSLEPRQIERVNTIQLEIERAQRARMKLPTRCVVNGPRLPERPLRPPNQWLMQK